MAPTTGSTPSRVRAMVYTVLGLVCLLLLLSIGWVHADGFLLDLGSILLPTPIHTQFLLAWVVLATPAAALIALGLAHLTTPESSTQLRAQWEAIPDTRWMGAVAFLAFLLPLLIRLHVLEGAPITDDESCYLFMSELLASGRLYAESPPMKLFFDRALMINDGRLYPMYFVGWPALMVPGTLLGFPGLMNPLYSGLTVVPLFLIARRLVGSSWAKLGSLLYLCSPLAMLGSATLLSHTSCAMAMSYAFLFTLRLADDKEPFWPDHIGLAISFSTAFFIRPTAALGLGLPLLAIWGWTVLKARLPWKPMVAFLLPSIILATLFLGVNVAQHGDPFKPGYVRKAEYEHENGYRFSNHNTEDGTMPSIDRTPSYNFETPLEGLATTGLGLIRLNFSLLGWPFSFLLMIFAGTSHPRIRWFWAGLGSFLLVHLMGIDAGVDTFGPTHYYECAIPILVLSIVGLSNVTHMAQTLQEEWPPTQHEEDKAIPFRLTVLPLTLVASLILLSSLVYIPLRVEVMSRLAANINAPHVAAQEHNLHNAVIFTNRPFAPNCISTPARSFVFWRPNNDPDLTNDLLWVNHIDIKRNRALMNHFPDRQGYVMLWSRDCKVHFAPLQGLRPGSVPASYIGGFDPETGQPNPHPRQQQGVPRP